MLIYYIVCVLVFFFFKQKTAYEMRISDWSSDVCSSDLDVGAGGSNPLSPTNFFKGLAHLCFFEVGRSSTQIARKRWGAGGLCRPLARPTLQTALPLAR